MIERQKSRFGWEFLFLGANIDAVKTAESFGITKERAVTYHQDSIGTRMNFDAVSQTVSCVRNQFPIQNNWKENVEKYAKRKKDVFKR